MESDIQKETTPPNNESNYEANKKPVDKDNRITLYSAASWPTSTSALNTRELNLLKTIATMGDIQNAPNAPQPETTDATPFKPIHALILDAGPLIKNDPPVSTLLAQAHELYTLPSVVSEIRDAATRSRVETTLMPFLKLRSPRPASVKFITDFARRTGDLEVLSKPDIHLMALAYELECEMNSGDWRLRKTPGQKGVNGKPPARPENDTTDSPEETTMPEESEKVEEERAEVTPSSDPIEATEPPVEQTQPIIEPETETETVTQTLESLSLEQPTPPTIDVVTETEDKTTEDTSPQEEGAEDNDDEGWITPSNLKKHQAKDQHVLPEQPVQRVLKVALLTSDYAMQNVLLRINLNLVSPGLARITRVKTWVLRCHGCFQITRDTSKQFCPRCGQATLTRVSCATDQAGNFTVYLKKNYQWNNRGNVYSVPKPVHGSASGKARGPGGGKNGWGRELIFAEDQKEFERKTDEQRRARQRDLMDDDYLPGILSGNRQAAPGRIRVGAGRNVNSRKRF
ncbi:Nin one binding Zn-ribbon like-domain-containing protein [Nemania serpens]|nr:Nin one binding Zn-ribbon like-domain-containing protein [Nemania serpens]